MAENDKPPDITTMSEFLGHLMVQGECTESVVRVAINGNLWMVTPPIVHQHLLVDGQVVKRDLRVSEDIFREACEKGFVMGKAKSAGVVSCTERVISYKGILYLSRYNNRVPAK